MKNNKLYKRFKDRAFKFMLYFKNKIPKEWLDFDDMEWVVIFLVFGMPLIICSFF